MVDKLRATQPLNITFSDGEQPTAAKLSAVATQSKNGSNLLEKAIGDLWTQSGDSILTSSFPLQLPNLARMLGQNKLLNPAIYPIETGFTFRENLGTKYLGKTSGFLKFVPSSSTFTPVDTTGQFTNLVASEHLVGDPEEGGAADEYFISTTDGRFRLDSELLSAEKLEYTVDPTTWAIGENTFPGIIPDPRQTEFTACRVEEVIFAGSGRFHIHLPPRRPLTFAAGDYGPLGGRPDKYPASADIGLAAGNEAISTAPPLRYWQSDTVAALDSAHYRYSLPKEIRDIHSSLAAGTEYPSGFLYLFDTSTGTIIDDAIFRKPSNGETREWIIEVSSDAFDLDALKTSDETETSYNSTSLILMTCGSSLARSLQTLATEFYQHEHNNIENQALDTLVLHNSLVGTNPPVDANNDHLGRYPTSLPRWSPSRWNNDDHTYLLSRAGSYGLAGNRYRDPNDNAMLGNLVLANSVADSNNVFLDVDNTDDSFKLAFGSNLGPFIKGTANNTIQIEHTQGGSVAAILNIGTTGGIGQLGVGVIPGTAQVKILGTGSNTGLVVDGSGSGAGIVSTSGATGSFGVDGVGQAFATGVRGTGGASDGIGVEALGGGTVGIGLEARGGGTNGTGVVAYGFGTGFGVEGRTDLGDGYAVVARPSSERAAIRMIPQGEPSTQDSGALYVNSTSGRASLSNGTTWNGQVGQHLGLAVDGNDFINTTSTKTAFASSYTVPGGTLRVGSTIRVRAWGVINGAVGGGTVEFSMEFGGLTQILGPNRTISSSEEFTFDMIFVVRSTGNGSSVWTSSGIATLGDAAPSAPDVSHNVFFISGENLTADKTIEILTKMSVSDANNEVELFGLVVDIAD
jgi:hypothetical protein